MSKRRKKHTKASGRRTSGTADGDSPKRRPAPVAKGKDTGGASWLGGKRPILQFVLLFGVFMGIFYAVTITELVESRAWPEYLRMNANASAWILRGLGEDATGSGEWVRSPRGNLRIARGCDAIQPSALFVSAVLASPVAMWSKLPGMAVGTVVLMLINLFRIISLYYVQIHFSRAAFEIMHIEVWQAFFIFLAILFWVLWAWWATNRRVAVADAPV